MADTATPASPAAKASTPKSCCSWSDWSWAAILLRLCAGALLLLSGTDKFKSATNPATYSLANYYGSKEQLDEGYVPKAVKIVNVVYVNSGLDNADKVGLKNANFFAWTFYLFGKALPWLMIVGGGMILLGIFSRLGYFIGGIAWLSLIIGQLLLPDPGVISQLLQIFIVHVGALAMVQYDRFCMKK
jgi:uncharacterized membrane protein YphA (DoxX/SURF4 family)